jgi:putative transposase
MTDYRRNRVPGGTYFFTVNLQDRASDLLVRHVSVLREAVRYTKASTPFHIDAWVVLPEHLHAIWTLPEEDADFTGRWSTIKKLFSRQMPKGEFCSPSRRKRRERGIWQRRFWEHTIRDDRDYAAHMDYVHFNPVRHGLVESAADWKFSSFHHAVAMGLYPSSWAGAADMPGVVGEP